LTEEVESSDMFRDRPFHRWRKNEGIDPDALEMQYKINLLQKRLISKTEECVEKEITVQEMTNEITSLKKLANKKPTFEIEKSIQLYKQELQKNSEKMKAIIAERNLFENMTEDLKAESSSLKREKDEIQMKYHEVRTKLNRVISN
jgi:chromosome segregation ATPase